MIKSYPAKKLFVASLVFYLLSVSQPIYAIENGQSLDEDFSQTVMRLINEGRLEQAEYLIRTSRPADARALESHWKELSNAAVAVDTETGNKRLRYQFLELYLNYGYRLAGRPIRPMVLDYLSLKEELYVAGHPQALRAETAKVLVDALEQRDATSVAYADLLFNQAMEILDQHPDDATPFHLFDWLFSHSHSSAVDYNRLTKACVTSENKVKLAYLLSWSRSSEFSHEVALAALPHLANDEERASLVWQAFRYGAPHSCKPDVAVEHLPFFIVRYADTKFVKSAFEYLVASTFELQGSDAALQLIDNYKSILKFDTSEFTAIQSSVVKMLLEKAVKNPGDQEAFNHEKAADRLVSELIDRPVDVLTQLNIIAVAYRVYKRLGKVAEMEKVAKTFVDLGKEGEFFSSDQRIASEVATFLMERRCFEDAINAWKMWRPTCGSCGSWDVDPQEFQRIQITTCYLALENYDAAIREISKSLLDDRYCNGFHEIVPVLLFYVYDRAGQLDDLRNIASEFETTGISHTNSRSYIFEKPNLPTSLPEKQNWGVRQLLKFRALSANGDYSTLTSFLSNRFGAFQDPNESSEYRVLKFAINWEAMQGIAKDPKVALEIADRALKDNGDLFSEWFFLALLIGDDMKGKSWLLEQCRITVLSERDPYNNSYNLLLCLPHLGADGKAIIDDLRSRAEKQDFHAIDKLEYLESYLSSLEKLKPFELSFQWPAPKAGSLPKSLMPIIKSITNNRPLPE